MASLSASEPTTLRLQGVLEVSTIAALWSSLRTQAAGVQVIDLSAVTAIDSSGVALVRCLQMFGSVQGREPEVVGAPRRYAQIRLAHRIEAGGD